MKNNMDILWIDENYIKKFTTVLKNVDMVFIKPHIIEAQNMNIHSLIGGYLYDTIYDEYVDNDLSGTTIQQKYINLVEDYIKPVILYYTLVYSLDDLFAKITNKGIEVQSSEFSESITEKQLQRLINKYENMAKTYSERLLDFLKYNDTTYIRWRDDDPNNPYNVKAEHDTAYKGNMFIGRTTKKGCFPRQNLRNI